MRDRAYLLATRSGADRTYRLSRVLAAEQLPEPAQRPDKVDLDRVWRECCAQFVSIDHVTVLVRVKPARREELLSTAVAVRAEEPDADGWLRLEVTFPDLTHAEFSLWQLSGDAEALSPQSLRTRLRDRAAALARMLREAGSHITADPTRASDQTMSRRAGRRPRPAASYAARRGPMTAAARFVRRSARAAAGSQGVPRALRRAIGRMS